MSMPTARGLPVSPRQGRGCAFLSTLALLLLPGCGPPGSDDAGRSQPAPPALDSGTEVAEAAQAPFEGSGLGVRLDGSSDFVRSEGPGDERYRAKPSVMSLLKLEPAAGAPEDFGELVRPALPTPAAGVARPVFEKPEHVRGIYLNMSAAGSARRSRELMQLAAGSEINSFVIDIKDAAGRVSHRSQVPLANEIGATARATISDLHQLLRELEARRIYPIARIVVVKDPLLGEHRPDLAIQDTAGGVWKDGSGVVWINPWNRESWEYPLALAQEAALAGFPEIQWDYIRLPDAPRSELARAVFPGKDERSHPQVIRAFLEHSRERLAEYGTTVTADVFGVTTSGRDVGIGQVWGQFIDVVDVALPMVYPNHYWKGSFGFDEPNFFPYEIVNRAIRDAVRNSAMIEGAGMVRPWLQDFDLSYIAPEYGPSEVRAQIQAVYDAGVHEWILWHPGSRYTEEALRPIGADDRWEEEFEIRVGGVIVPASERHEALEAWRAANGN